MVDSRLQIGPHYSLVGTHSQVLGLWVEDWFIASFYAPPWENSKQVDPQVEAGSSTRVAGSVVVMLMRFPMIAF